MRPPKFILKLFFFFNYLTTDNRKNNIFLFHNSKTHTDGIFRKGKNKENPNYGKEKKNNPPFYTFFFRTTQPFEKKKY